MDQNTEHPSDVEGGDRAEVASEMTLPHEDTPTQAVAVGPGSHGFKTTVGGQQDADASGETKETPKVYAKGVNILLISLGLALSVMCMGLDRTILATAIPKITAEFNSLPDVGWYGSSYLLTSCCFQLMYGKLYAEFNIKWVYLAALAIFELGSIICAVAPNSIALIIGRAVSGLGSAGVFTGAITILALSVPLHDRPKFTGAIGACSGIVQVIAPFLGGVFTDKLTWRWCFWINLPLGSITLLVILLCVHLPAQTKKGPSKTLWQVLRKFDFIGTFFLFPAVVCLLLALEWGQSQYPWSNWRVILLLCIFGVAISIWTFIQWRLGDDATVPVRIIRMRSMAGAMWFSFCIVGVMSGIIQYVPIWFQAVKNVSAYQSGINLLTATGATTLAAVMSGFLTSKIGYYVPQMYISTITSSIATGLICRFDTDTSTGYWVGALILYGFGGGIGVQQPLMIPQTVLSPTDISRGTSLIIFAQTISGALFLSIGINVLQDRLIAELEEIVPQVNPAVVIAAGAAELVASMEKVYPQYVSGILEGYAKALQAVFLIFVVLAVVSILGAVVVEWKSVTKNKKQATEVGPDLVTEEKVATG